MAGASNNLTGATLPMLAPFDICNMVYSGMFTANDIIAFGGMPALTWSQFIGKLTSGNLCKYINTLLRYNDTIQSTGLRLSQSLFHYYVTSLLLATAGQACCCNCYSNLASWSACTF